METFENQTKPEIQTSLKQDDGINPRYIQKALHIYEIYDETIIKGIIFRLNIKDKLQLYQDRNQTVFKSRSAVKKVLQRMNVDMFHIDMALNHYEMDTVGDPDYHLEDVVDTVLNLRHMDPINPITVCAPEDINFRLQAVKSPEGYNEDTSSYNSHETSVESDEFMAGDDGIDVISDSESIQYYDPIKVFEEEVIDSEKAYYEELNILLSQWILPMFLKQYISPKHMMKIRSSLPAIIEFHDGLLTALNTSFNSKYQSMAKNFDRFMTKNSDTFIEIYSSFASDYNDILYLFGVTLYKEKWLGDFIKKMMRNTGKSLLYYLMLPIQRISAYILLLQQWKKYTDSDHDHIDHTMSIISKVANIMNKAQDKVKDVAQCLTVQQSLNGLKHPLVDSRNCRQFEGKFEFKLIEKEAVIESTLYVFNDIVLLVTNDDNTVQYVFDVRAMDIKRDVDGVVNVLRFTLITGVTKPMVFVSEYKENITALQRLIQVNRYDILAQGLLDSSEPGAILTNHLAHQLASIL